MGACAGRLVRSICLLIEICVYILCNYESMYVSISLYTYLPTYLCIYVFISLHTFLPTHLCMHASIDLDLSIYLGGEVLSVSRESEDFFELAQFDGDLPFLSDPRLSYSKTELEPHVCRQLGRYVCR